MIGLDFCSNIKKIFISQRHCYSLNPLVLSENIFISSNASTLANLFQKEQVVPYNDTRSGILNQSSSPGRFFSMISNDDDCHKINSAWIECVWCYFTNMDRWNIWRFYNSHKGSDSSRPSRSRPSHQTIGHVLVALPLKGLQETVLLLQQWLWCWKLRLFLYSLHVNNISLIIYAWLHFYMLSVSVNRMYNHIVGNYLFLRIKVGLSPKAIHTAHREKN